jgi:hypothetical protein
MMRTCSQCGGAGYLIGMYHGAKLYACTVCHLQWDDDQELLQRIGNDVFYATWDNLARPPEQLEGLLWVEKGQPRLLANSSQGWNVIPFEHGGAWMTSNNVELMANFSVYPWLHCAECAEVSYDHYLCPSCRIV